MIASGTPVRVERQQPEFARQPGGIVRHEVADHLHAAHAAHAGLTQMPAQHVEVPRSAVARGQVYPRLHDHAPLTVGAHRIFHRRDDLRIRQAQRVYIRPGQEAKPQLTVHHPGRYHRISPAAAQRAWPTGRAGHAALVVIT
jgi:hypothetical protein